MRWPSCPAATSSRSSWPRSWRPRPDQPPMCTDVHRFVSVVIGGNRWFGPSGSLALRLLLEVGVHHVVVAARAAALIGAAGRPGPARGPWLACAGTALLGGLGGG